MEKLVLKESENAALKGQVKTLSNELDRTLKKLQDLENEYHRTNQALISMRDAAIQRDLELTSVRQALATRKADSDMADSQQLKAIHMLRKTVEDLEEQVDQERRDRIKVQEDKRKVEHALQEEIQLIQQEKKTLQAATLEAEARDSVWSQKVEELQTELQAKANELDTALSALSSSIQEQKQLQMHSQKSALSHEAHVRELQQQVLLLSEGVATKSTEQHARLAALVTAFNKLREESEGQERQATKLSVDKRQLEEENKSLNERVKDLTSLVTSMQAEKEKLQVRLKEESVRLSKAQMQLTLEQHKAREEGLRSQHFNPVPQYENEDSAWKMPETSSSQRSVDVSYQYLRNPEVFHPNRVSAGQSPLKGSLALQKHQQVLSAQSSPQESARKQSRSSTQAVDFLTHRNEELLRENLALRRGLHPS
ncbi:hypothetical protein CEUSTIGMA_g4897.t1 [Chlamydomonas eustigma]|uniref:Uncharacterized protein n=1 Tax=Chlamydomonas eustigma TaxID=1157962 RepID=A0A250X2Z4_9CHLO|nr:hypothetical protein CEUSTIGMA_g4897.t1 [Chlamydomonas eustigma]|eukprot:GAX77453.1 hypothetical protein CEUSTIGMA_g4897.t1 [Chlamydomonas eustigma]